MYSPNPNISLSSRKILNIVTELISKKKNKRMRIADIFLIGIIFFILKKNLIVKVYQTAKAQRWIVSHKYSNSNCMIVPSKIIMMY